MKRRKGAPSTVPKAHPPKRRAAKAVRAKPPRGPLPPRAQTRKPAPRPPQPRPPKREVARIIDDGDRSLVDVLDSLLNQGVVLNAELVLALANVDLVYVKLTALLCAADRVLPPRGE